MFLRTRVAFFAQGWGGSRVKGKRRPVLEARIFPKHQAGHAFSHGTFSVGDFSSKVVIDSPNSTNS
jgi:hypothetical protein